MIVGIDEVGRGCWAGPLAAGAVLLRRSIPGLKDSKQLSREQREKLDVIIRKQALAFGVGWAEASEIDALGMTAAIKLAMERALDCIKIDYKEVVIDGSLNFLRDNPKVRSLTKADLFIPAVSAASIIAKVARDNFMAELAAKYPGYGFERHVGYGTAIHSAALNQLGVSDIHRKSFKPIRALQV
jgi:ribonuclease HII